MANAVQFDEDEISESGIRSARQILLQSIILGLLADNVFRRAPDGLGWGLWTAALAFAAILVARYREQRLRREQIVWLGVAVAFAFFVAWRAAEELQILNTVATLIALALFASVSAGRPMISVLASRIRDVVAALYYAAIDGLSGGLKLIFRDIDLPSALRAAASTHWGGPAVRAILLAAPLFFVFTVLLSRADPVFGALFDFNVRLDDAFEHVLVAGIFAWLSAGWMRASFLSTTGRTPLPVRLPFELGTIEVTAALGTVVALFAVFVGIQARWLFGGADVVQATTGLTVAEYARRGFFELVMVAALVFPLILGTRAALNDDVARRRHARLSVVLLILLAAIIASAILRMRLYVEYFGLTTDRLYALTFMLWLAVVFVGMALTLLRGWEKPFTTLTVATGFATLLGLNVVNPEAVVARVNLSRTATLATDYRYLARLSADAVPFVAPALAATTPSDETCAAAKILRSRFVGVEPKRSNLSKWRSRDVVVDHLPVATQQRLCLVKPAQ